MTRARRGAVAQGSAPVRAATVVGARVHGGPDALGVPWWDFSTNANACGPCPLAWARVQAAPRRHYPDPDYHALRQRLADWHGVEPHRILLAASGSEWILRWGAWCARRGWRRMALPSPGYGEYAHAAAVWGLQPVDEGAQTAWLCDPGSPWGQPEDESRAAALLQEGGATAVALDQAYAPLRLEPAARLPESLCQRCWQLWTPNKALGMTGVRAAYVVAPAQADPAALRELEQLAPAWPLGADGVALLHAWTEPTAQRWLRASLSTLAQWKEYLVGNLRALGWQVRDSVTPFVCARPPQPLAAEPLRARGIKLRDAGSFGLPGWWRLSAQPPQAVQALVQALRGLSAAEVAGEGEP